MLIDNFRNSLEHASAATDQQNLNTLVDIGPITGSVTSGYTPHLLIHQDLEEQQLLNE